MTTKDKFPSPAELENDFNEFLSKKYGGSVRIGMFPMPKGDEESEEGEETKESKSLNIRFDLKPEELEAYLDKYIIKQAEAKEILATKICTHFHRVKLPKDDAPLGEIKNNILMIGPTGVGKTYLIKLIANKLGVPFVKGDATKFSETGYVGGDVEQLVRDLVHEAGGDIELAQHGIIYIDEIDKIAASNTTIGPDVSRTGVQRNLLKLMEDTDVDLKVPHDLASQLEAALKFQKTGKVERKKINTRNILFIVSGAFAGLEEIIRRRLNQQGIGFTSKVQSKSEYQVEILRQVKAEDLIAYGFESEFIGRLPVIAVLEDLEVEDLYQILKNPNSSVIQSKRRDFRSYGIDLRFEDEALWEIARRAHQEKTGARGLVSTLERVLIKFEKKLPSTNIRRLVVTREMVENPEAELAILLQEPNNPRQAEAYARLLEEEKVRLRRELLELWRRYQEEHGEPLGLSSLGVELAVEQVVSQGIKPETACQNLAGIYREIHQAEQEFSKIYELDICFDAEAAGRIAQKVVQEKVSAREICHEVLKNYQHGLKLIKGNGEHKPFVIPRAGVDDPYNFLSELISKHFSNQPSVKGSADE